MRTSTALFFRQSTSQLNRLQTELTRTQLQISTGQRLLSPSDDPVAAAQITSITAALEQNEQFQRNAGLAEGRLSIEETTLADVQNALFRVRDLALQANNDTQTFESRRFIAVEVEEILSQLVELGNRRDGQGNFVFSGFQSRTEPFAKSNGEVIYNGDQGDRRVQIGPTRFVDDGDSGGEVFVEIANGNGQFATNALETNTGTGVIDAGSLNGITRWPEESYAVAFTAPDQYNVLDSLGAIVQTGTFAPGDTIDIPGATLSIDGQPATGDSFTVTPSESQDIFATVQNLVDALRNDVGGQEGSALLNNRVNNVLSDLDQGIGNVLDIRARVGSRLQAIDAQENSNADLELTLQSTRSQLQDVDFAEAISNLNQQLTSLQAAQQTFARVQGLSLFNVL
ncbi:MAG: flagellar hook-associated protein FlgL [Gammaproteobacteria bacterium]